MIRDAFSKALLTALLAASAYAADKLDPTLPVVLGGGLSAGYSGFRLTETAQNQAWPVLVAKQMGSYISVPTMRESGQVGVVNSYRPLSGLLPQVAQSGERALPFPVFTMNLSVPFLKTGDSLRKKPAPQYDGIKLITAIEGDIQTTLLNAIVGGPLLTFTPPVLLTQTEYAETLNPTLAFINLGFEDVAEAAVASDAAKITATDSFTTDFTNILTRMIKTNATVIAMTVPDPTETAYFFTQDEAARQYGVTAEDLRARFGLASGDLLTLGGMVEVADALRGRRRNPLSRGSVLTAAVAGSVRSAVTAYNNAIRNAVQGKNAQVFDLADLLHQAKLAGTAAYLGRIYSEDGLYPSAAGQALIANAVLQFINSKYGTNYANVAVPQ